MIDEHLKKWRELPVTDYRPADVPQPDYAGTIYRLSWSWDNEDESLSDLMDTFFAGDAVDQTTGLILGMVGETADTMHEFVEKLVAASPKIPNLKALFIGEMIQEESEISWIEYEDISAVFDAFPQMEELRVRGGGALSIKPDLRHAHLKKLIFESGGLPKDVVVPLASATFPELEHLELWLGTDEYGGNTSIEDLSPLLNKPIFPKLKHLGLRNSDLQNEIARAIAAAPILAQIESLDLSLGVLRDEGAEALLASEGIHKLKKLDLHRHFMSESAMKRFGTIGIEVDVSDPQEPEEWDDEKHYYIAVSE